MTHRISNHPWNLTNKHYTESNRVNKRTFRRTVFRRATKSPIDDIRTIISDRNHRLYSPAVSTQNGTIVKGISAPRGYFSRSHPILRPSLSFSSASEPRLENVQRRSLLRRPSLLLPVRRDISPVQFFLSSGFKSSRDCLSDVSTFCEMIQRKRKYFPRIPCETVRGTALRKTA